jgi:hypothetical protein
MSGLALAAFDPQLDESRGLEVGVESERLLVIRRGEEENRVAPSGGSPETGVFWTGFPTSWRE